MLHLCFLILISETGSFNVNLIETQKKFIPSDASILNIKSAMSDICERTSNLIVVASLIDKAPNLGGLTRTCEVFAVSALVVHDHFIIRNKEFTSLSITAEKHVPLVEVSCSDYHNNKL